MVTMLAVLMAYALGCGATGYYLVRWRTGEDIRRIGSGTTGAFNVMRRLGAGGFSVTCAGDVAKGALAVGIAQAAGLDVSGQLLALSAVVLGHNFPVQLGWRGGNGLAPLTGALLVFDGAVWLMLLAVFSGVVLLVLVLRYFRLPVQVYTPAKVTVLCVPLAAWVMQRPLFVTAGLALIVALVMATILQNFRRLARLPVPSL